MTPALQEINRLSLQSVLEQHHFSLRLILRSFCPDVRNFSTPLQWFTFVQLLYPYLPISWIGFSQTLSTIAVHNSTFGWFRAIAYNDPDGPTIILFTACSHFIAVAASWHTMSSTGADKRRPFRHAHSKSLLFWFIFSVQGKIHKILRTS